MGVDQNDTGFAGAKDASYSDRSKNYETVAPSAASFIESLRDIGYSFKHALADIIDNSIAAGSTEIDIFSVVSRSELMIEIQDNGSGMSRSELISAMRLGSRSPLDVRSADDLGRFGLGLKTASFSQCRLLSVFTRKDGEASGAVWDLDYVQKHDQWKIAIPSQETIDHNLKELGNDGTIVRWEVMDRVGTLPLSDSDIDDITKLVDDARAHLSIVFHRFLTREGLHPPIEIRLNGRNLVAFDPFWENHPHTTATPPEAEKIGFRGGTVSIQAFTLPHHSNCSRSDWDKHAGPGGYVANQGFYLYRARRLLIWGTWFGLDRKRAINQLCRVRVDVDNSLDAEWKVNIRKSSAQPPPEIRRRLRALVDSIVNGTKRVYRQRGQRLVSQNAYPIWQRHIGEEGFYYTPDPEHPFMTEFAKSMDEVQLKMFRRVLSLVGASLPYGAILSDVGDDPGGHSTEGMDADTRLELASDFVRSLMSANLTIDEALAATRKHPAFAPKWKVLAPMLERSMIELKDRQGREK